MINRPSLLMFLMFLCIAAVVSPAAADDGASPLKARCPVCRMFVSMFADWNARIELRDSTVATFDGPKCMFKYYLDIERFAMGRTQADIRAIFVKDYYSKADIAAREAYFVIWSDIYGPMGHEPIPFRLEGDARRFLSEHKGREILRFQDINRDLIASLDNP